MKRAIQERIAAVMGGRVEAARRLSGGMISDAIALDLADGARLVAKIGDGSHDLRIEAYMLSYLRERSGLPLPAVFHADANLLLIEFIDGATGLDDRCRRHLAELMAACHQISAEAYGLERDTLTGPIRQPNQPLPSWIVFFRERRFLYMLGVARESGKLPIEMEMRLLRFAEALETWLIEPPRPSLIHGDLWRENILTRDGRVVGIIDPALYYAHHEIELAYMSLFDGVGAAFFDAYHALSPIDPDFFSARRHVYNVYPLLTHVAIFGAKYLPHVDETLKRFDY